MPYIAKFGQVDGVLRKAYVRHIAHHDKGYKMSFLSHIFSQASAQPSAVATQEVSTPSVPSAATAPTASVAPTAPVSAARARQMYGTNGYGSFSYSDADANRILMQAGQKGFDLASRMKRAANQDELASKQQGLRDQAAQIHGEQRSAIQGMASKLLATGVQASAGYKGTKLRNDDVDQKKALGAGLDSAAQGGAFGNLVTGTSDLQDKLGGGAYQADQAKLAMKENDVQISIATQRKESATAGVDMAKKVIETALQNKHDQAQRQADVINKLTGG